MFSKNAVRHVTTMLCCYMPDGIFAKIGAVTFSTNVTCLTAFLPKRASGIFYQCYMPDGIFAETGQTRFSTNTIFLTGLASLSTKNPDNT